MKKMLGEFPIGIPRATCWRLGVIVVCLFCNQCVDIPAPLTAREKDASKWVVDTIVNKVKKDMPWKTNAPSNLDVEPRNVVGSRNDDYLPGRDDPNDLLERMKRGDGKALYKLNQYLHASPKWPLRIEVYRYEARIQGLPGIAALYAKTNDDPSMRADHKVVEWGLRSMEEEARRGSWLDSVALYQFYGWLSETGCDPPWGSCEELAAKWLDNAYRTGDRLKTDNVVADSWRGSREEPGVYPGTPAGWKPSMRK